MSPPGPSNIRRPTGRDRAGRMLLLAALVAFPAAALAQPFPCLPASACPAWTQDVAPVASPGILLAGPGGTAFQARVDLENVTSPAGATAVLRVLRFDAATGAALWSVKVDRDVEPAQMVLAAESGRVHLLGTENVLGAFRAVLLAFDAADGALVWTADATGPGRAHALALSPDGTRLAAGGVRLRASDDAWVSLWNASTGALLWQRTLDGMGGLDTRFHERSRDAAHVLAFRPDGARLYAAGMLARAGEDRYDGLAWALHAADGADAWLVRTGAVAQSQHHALAADAGRVYVAGTEGAYALDGGTGAVLWAPAESLPSCTRPNNARLAEACRLLLAPDGALFLRATHVLLRLDPATGLPAWAHPIRFESVLDPATADLDPSGARLAVALLGATAEAGLAPQLTDDVEVRILDAADGRLLQRGWLDMGHHEDARVARFAGQHLVVVGGLSRADGGLHHAFAASFPTHPTP